MSCKSYTSCGGSVRLGTASGHEIVLDALYERKRDKKTVRVLTVVIYVFCVSLAAIMLSLYYVFFWEPKDAQYAQRKVFPTVEKQTSTTPMPTCFMPHTGGGDTPVSEVTFEPPPPNITYDSTNTSMPPGAEAAIDSALELTVLPANTPSADHILNTTSDDIDTFNGTDSIT